MVCDQHGPSATLISFAKDYEDERALFAIGLRISDGGNVLGRAFFVMGWGHGTAFWCLEDFIYFRGPANKLRWMDDGRLQQ